MERVMTEFDIGDTITFCNSKSLWRKSFIIEKCLKERQRKDGSTFEYFFYNLSLYDGFKEVIYSNVYLTRMVLIEKWNQDFR